MKRIFSLFICLIVILSAFSQGALSILAAGESEGDIVKRESYGFYKNDFESVTGNNFLFSERIDSSETGGALMVAPSDTNVWRTSSGFGETNQIIISFKFMLPQALKSGETIKLFYDCVSSDYLIKITAGSGGSVASMKEGNDLVTSQIKENVWHQVMVIITQKLIMVYFDQSYLGSVGADFSKYSFGESLFAFNRLANDNPCVYYLDDLIVSTVADDSFIKLVAYQKSNVSGGTYNIRYVAVLMGIFECEELIGFEITSQTNEKTWDLTTQSVYTSITTNFGVGSATAKSLGGKYVTAGTILKIPANMKTVNFTATPYVKIMGVKIYGSTISLQSVPPKTTP